MRHRENMERDSEREREKGTERERSVLFVFDPNKEIKEILPHADCDVETVGYLGLLRETAEGEESLQPCMNHALGNELPGRIGHSQHPCLANIMETLRREHNEVPAD